MSVTYSTTVVKDDQVNATGLQVPPEVMAALGASTKKPPVKVTIGDYTYQTTVAVMGGVSMLALSAENRKAAGVEPGATIEVTLELDLEPRIVEVPDDLAMALAAQSGARAAFDALAFSKRKEFVRQVNDAKTQETRDRRIAAIVTKMGEGA